VTDKRYRRQAELMEAELGNELVALDVEAGNCFGFNEVATSVWRVLATAMTFAQLQESLLAEYEVRPEKCRDELQELLDDMLDKGLIAAA